MPVAPIHLPDIHIKDQAAGITLTLNINDNLHLHGAFEAPTRGWLAVGLNRSSNLPGTRFLMAASQGQQSLCAEEHIAHPPDHFPLAHFNAQPMFSLNALTPLNAGTRITFTIKRSVSGPFPGDFMPGQNAGLMLAWSHEKDFNHHSAWREHFSITV